MTGTGTQADPLVITDAADLYSLSTSGGPAMYCKLGSDIDLNGTPYAENFSPIPLNCCELDGDGHCIRNIYVNTPNRNVKVFNIPFYGGDMVLKNLRLENTELIGENISVIASDYQNTVSLYNCTFVLNIRRMSDMSAISTTHCLMASERVSLSMELSTIAVSGYYKRQFAVARNSQVRRCHFHLVLEIGLGDTSDGSSGSFLTGCTLTDSYVTGSITAASQLTDSTNMSYNCSFNNSYTALSYINQNNVYWNGNMTTPCFYDKELAGNRDFTASRTYYGLTTVQCKNAEYLQSIGFLVAGGE
ncbi:MAG: hypothetical protein IKO47_07970 [Ruminococcus sp.]|nr:hypothetical protein [Ruminococcus sp.]